MTGQLRSQASEAVAGRLVIELGQVSTPGEFERQLRVALRDPTLSRPALVRFDRDVSRWRRSVAALPADGASIAP